LREKGVVLRSQLREHENHNFIPEDLSSYKVVQPGDLVINKMKAWQGSMGISQWHGIVSPAYFVFTLDIQERDFSSRLLRSRPYVSFFGRASDGVRIGQWDLSISGMKRIPALIPPVAEQRQIGAFLTDFDRRINRAIRSKRRLIGLMEEQKQAIIHRTVTRGLDPGVRLKPSGFHWLGEVPRHWQLSRLKFVASDIVDCLHATPVYVDGAPYAAIRTADIEPGRVRMASARRISEAQYRLWTARLVPRAGDILYSREGERYGIAALVPEDVELCISQRMMVFRIVPEHSSGYVMWLLNCPEVYSQAAADMIGATAPHVNVSTIKNYVLALPPRDEQLAIVSAITDAVAPLDEAKARADREISLLREYRTRLVADVVTGQLDVRGVSLPPLPDADAEDPEAGLDDADDADLLEAAESLDDDGQDRPESGYWSRKDAKNAKNAKKKER
jgi:type I restriction enzyme S subunit